MIYYWYGIKVKVTKTYKAHTGVLMALIEPISKVPDMFYPSTEKVPYNFLKQAR